MPESKILKKIGVEEIKTNFADFQPGSRNAAEHLFSLRMIRVFRKNRQEWLK
jgi:hypothetical protein